MVRLWDPDAVFYPLLGRNSKTWASLFLSSGTTSLSTSEHQTSHFALGRLSVNQGFASPKVTHSRTRTPEVTRGASCRHGRGLISGRWARVHPGAPGEGPSGGLTWLRLRGRCCR